MAFIHNCIVYFLCSITCILALWRILNIFIVCCAQKKQTLKESFLQGLFGYKSIIWLCGNRYNYGQTALGDSCRVVALVSRL